MSKSIEISRYKVEVWPYRRVRIKMIETPYYGPATYKQFSLSEDEFVRALTKAGLYERVEVSAPESKFDKNNPADVEILKAEVAMYASLSSPFGSNEAISEEGKAKRNKLWTRILRKLEL